MKYNDMFKIVKELEFDKEKVVCIDKDVELFILRPSKLSARFKDYDKHKNFQIWLREGSRVFRPNHLRFMIDLNLKVRSRPGLKKKLLTIFDNIFYGKDPDEEMKLVDGEKFEHYLNSLKIIAYMAQLFIIEQEYGYNKPSKFDPKTLFLQGWIREFIDSPKEIDNLCMSVANGQPPKIQYTFKENKKHAKYEEKREPLWYLETQ
ncbi:MAG: hypothetical protein ABIE94_03310 [archaeon]